jgi:hypothetical protein
MSGNFMPQLLMSRLFTVAQFQHVADDKELPAVSNVIFQDSP